MENRSNENLHRAKSAKNDEFYTLEEDISKEVVNYKGQYLNKIIYCPCDDWEKSNFYRHFKEHYHEYGLRGLWATCYCPGGKGKYAQYDGRTETTGYLDGDGDFRSPECREWKHLCDIVITNPPFSLFREFVEWMEN